MGKIVILANRLAESVLMNWDEEEVIKLAKEVAVACKENIDFTSLVKRMREAQMDKDILEMRLRFKIDQDEKISDEDNAEFATAMCNVVFYEDKVDEHIKKMEV